MSLQSLRAAPERGLETSCLQREVFSMAGFVEV